MNLQKKIAFVSRNKVHSLASFVGNTEKLIGKFFWTDASQGELLSLQLAEFQPDLLIVYQPEMFSEYEAMFTRYLTVGYFLDPLPSHGFYEEPKLMQNFERLKSSSLDESTAYKFLIARNSSFSQMYDLLFDIWQYRALPVNDLLFKSKFEPALSGQDDIFFVGELNEYTSQFIDRINEDRPVVIHQEVFNNENEIIHFPIGLNLHCFKFSDFEHEALIHMANGRLLLSQPLAPAMNFKNGFSHLEFDGPDDLADLLEDVSNYPNSYESIRRYGFHAAFRYRASKVWSEFYQDVELSR